MPRAFLLILTVAVGLVFASGYSNRPIVLFNGQFLTMDSQNSVVKAIGLQSGYIRAVGNREEVAATISRLRKGLPWHVRLFGTRYVDLNGQNIIPGFIDAHGHFPANGLIKVGLNLSSPPFGEVHDIAMLLQAVKNQTLHQSDSRWIIGFNYDDAGLSEQRHPTRAELDQAAPNHAVYLRHRSGHMGVANTRALQEMGYTSETRSELGKGVRQDGLLQESAAPGMPRLLEEIPWWRLPAILFRARDDYLQAGITTLQNGFADKLTFQLLRYASKSGLISQRIVFWPAHDKLDVTPAESVLQIDAKGAPMSSGQRLAQAIDWPIDNSTDIAVGAIKLIADGSPQGRTAWLSEPYLYDELLGEDYRGFANLQNKTLHELVLRYHKAGFQLALHGNGDAAIQSIIDALQVAISEFPRDDARHIIVHAQTINKSQLRALALLDVSVSFFPTHTYYWGDWYRRRVLGESRAALISPLASADESGVRYTIHADSPVTPINPMQMLWSATQRLTASGYLLGAEERVSRQRALRALTIDAAWQNHLEGDRGSLEVGKLADFVVISHDPLTVDDVRYIKIREVWIGGKRRLHMTR